MSMFYFLSVLKAWFSISHLCECIQYMQEYRCGAHDTTRRTTEFKVCVLRNSPPPLSLMSVQNCLFFLFFLLVQKFESKNNSFIQQDVIEIVKSDSKDISVWNEHCFLFIKESWKNYLF